MPVIHTTRDISYTGLKTTLNLKESYYKPHREHYKPAKSKEITSYSDSKKALFLDLKNTHTSYLTKL